MQAGRLQILNQISELVSQAPDDKPLWIHLTAEDGAGKNYLLSQIENSFSGKYPVVFHLDFNWLNLNSPKSLLHFLKRIRSKYSTIFQVYLKTFNRHQQKSIDELLESGTANDGRLEWDLFSQFIYHIACRYKVLFILKNVFDAPPDASAALRNCLNNHPLLSVRIISSGIKLPGKDSFTEKIYPFYIPKLSLKEAEILIQEYLKTHPINARMINNQLYLKAAGNPWRIKFLLEAVYRPLLPDKAGQLLDPALLKNIQIPPPEPAFRVLLDKMPSKARHLLGFLSRLEEPLPQNLFEKLRKNLKITRREFADWIEKGWLRQELQLNEIYIHIPWQEWKDFLKRTISAGEYESLLLNNFNYFVKAATDSVIQVSDQYFEIEQEDRALKLACREARYFTEQGQITRALDRYAFLRRNLFNQKNMPVSRAQILEEMGDIQNKAGLYENAFETFRELREGLTRKETEDWLRISIKMAANLLEMDALSEARYLIRELKIKKHTNRRMRALVLKMLGDVDLHQGREDYALKSYREALQMIVPGENDVLTAEIYRQIKSVFNQKPETADWEFLSGVERLFSEDSYFRFQIQLEGVREALSRNDYRGTLDRALDIYRRLLRCFYPSLQIQANIYLCDIEAYLGKWWLVRSHLFRLLDSAWVLPNSHLYVRLLLHLAVVEKELARYGNAMKHLRQALEICFARHYIRELHEVKIHLGHIHLLVHGLFRAREYLREALDWAEENQAEDLMVTAALFLSAYELQKNQFQRAESFLQKAKTFIELLKDPFDRLNYLFYYIQYLFLTQQWEEAEEYLAVFEAGSIGACKFEILSRWLRGRKELLTGNLQDAESRLVQALHLSRKFAMPHLELQVLSDLIRLAKSERKPDKLQAYLKEARINFKQIQKFIGDEILKTQFEESREFEDILEHFPPLEEG